TLLPSNPPREEEERVVDLGFWGAGGLFSDRPLTISEPSLTVPEMSGLPMFTLGDGPGTDPLAQNGLSGRYLVPPIFCHVEPISVSVRPNAVSLGTMNRRCNGCS